jgi:protein-tyrosine phosphatase
MTSSLFIVTDTPAPLAGMRFPAPDTDWRALHHRRFAVVIRLHPADYDPAPLVAHDLVLEDLYGGATPADPAREKRRVWEAARLAAQHVAHGDGVIVHCLGGKGRTGTVLVCALRELGRSTDDAIDTVRAQRPQWPESPWQEKLARSEPPLR